MDMQLKNRLVGAAVLFSLGIIFIPLLLDGKPEKREQLVIPAEPAPLEQTMLLPQQRGLTQQPLQPEVQPVLQSTVVAEPANANFKQDPLFQQKVTPRKTPTTSAKSQRKEKVWVIQVGSFASRKNAHGLTLKLQKLGYQAFEEQVATKKGNIVRVRIGPEVDYNRAKKIRSEIKRKMNLSGLVVRYP